jgi:hypothetical protein
MDRTHSNIVVIVRCLGLVAVTMGLIWFVKLATTVLLFALGAPPDILNPIYGHALQGLVSGPLLFILGVVLLRKSGRLAAFVLKGAKDDVA